MGEHRNQFQSRLKQISRKHAALSAGYSARMQPDGLLVARPLRTPSRSIRRKVVYILAAFVICKAALIAAHGTGSYDARVLKLSQGDQVEQIGALVMQRDPLSTFLAQTVAPLWG